MSPNDSNTPVIPIIPQQDQQGPPAQVNSIVVPPPPLQAVDPTTFSKPSPASNATASESVDPCCSNVAAIGFLALGLIMFLIFVTIAGYLGQSSTAFCEGYVSLETLSYRKLQFNILS